MAVIDDIKTELGSTAPAGDLLNLWIQDAYALVNERANRLGRVPSPEMLEYVIRKAVVAHARRPSDETQVDIAVDDGRVSRRYSSSRGEVSLTPDWWALLGLPEDATAEWCGSIPYAGF